MDTSMGAAMVECCCSWLQQREVHQQLSGVAESLDYICHHLGSMLQKKNTSYRTHQCTPVNKRVAIALWRLATTVYRYCVQDFYNGVIQVLLPEHIKTPDARKLMGMATFLTTDGMHLNMLEQ